MNIGLGTVQFGQNYGVSNKQGITPEEEVARILAFAWENGITLLDTAKMYAESEEVIGRNVPMDASFNIVTKTPVFHGATIYKRDADTVKDSFFSSLYKLRKPNIYGLLIHHVDDLFKNGGEYLWDSMQDLKMMGFVQKIGISLYSPHELKSILSKYVPDIVQIPLNVLDQRMIHNGLLQNLHRLGIEIHCRSVFLQGLLLMSPEELPEYFHSIRNLMRQYREALRNQNISPLGAALLFAHQQTDIDYVILGINSQRHLKEILNEIQLFSSKPRVDLTAFAVNDEKIINPSLWPH